jgi:SWI/SNF-related matrix-associated actin-dependent regulator 1 of chromatin subfamily A
VQTIAFLGWLRYHKEFLLSTTSKYTKKPHLIVVPASTLTNWQNEFERFCPSFIIETYHGSQNERGQLRYEITSSINNNEVDVVLTTYSIFEKESGKEDRSFLNKQNFEYLILDEAHCLKNNKSSRYMNLSNLKTKNRLLLSGTPVQNNLNELLSMLSFLMPNVFGKNNCEILMQVFGWNNVTLGFLLFFFIFFFLCN